MARTRNLGNLTDLLTAGSTYVTTTTPPQFDNGTNLSTAGFVQRALGNFSGYLSLGVNTALTAAHAGFFITCAGTTLTITLPQVSTMVIGSQITISAAGGATALTVATFAGDTLVGANNPNTSILMGVDEYLTAIVVGPTSWVVIGNTPRILSQNAMFSTSLLSTAGFQKLPSGVILQWGNGNYTAQTTTTSNFAMTFPNSCLATYASLGFNLSLTTNSVGIGIQAISTSQFKLTVPSAGAGTTGCSWLAIGV
jgi:hypothetical protein